MDAVAELRRSSCPRPGRLDSRIDARPASARSCGFAAQTSAAARAGHLAAPRTAIRCTAVAVEAAGAHPEPSARGYCSACGRGRGDGAEDADAGSGARTTRAHGARERGARSPSRIRTLATARPRPPTPRRAGRLRQRRRRVLDRRFPRTWPLPTARRSGRRPCRPRSRSARRSRPKTLDGPP